MSFPRGNESGASMIDVTSAACFSCPHCGLLCDDLSLVGERSGAQVIGNACAIGHAAFTRALAAAALPPRVDGAAVDLDTAVGAAAAILARARQPLIGGLATDVAGMRAALALADRCGAIVDHMNGGARLRNLSALQGAGWVATTLAEVKNRAELIIFVGTDVVGRFPRFFERFVWNSETLFGLQPARRELVYLGGGLDISAGIAPDGRAPLHIPCEIARIGEAFGVLRALLAGRSVHAAEAAGVAMEDWRELARKMSQASYGVVVWVAADLDFPHADVSVRSLCGLLKDLNAATRFAGLPLGGSDADLTADAVALWQTGFPLRSRVGVGGPAYDPFHHATQRLLDANEADAMVWIGAIDPKRTPPATAAPTVVLGAAGMQPSREPEVFIPVGTPGVDHAGHLLRADTVVVMRLEALRPASLPSVAQVASAIERALPC